MARLSVLIASRQERYLIKTIESVLEAATDDTEVRAVVDGPQDGPSLADASIFADNRVHVIWHEEPIGQRQSINEAARASSAQFILKTDAHSTFELGFDTKLMADIEYDWTVIPRMYNLHTHDQICAHCGEAYYNRPDMASCEKCGTKGRMNRTLVWQRNMKKPPTDWMWFRSPDCKVEPLRVKYWDAPTAREFPAEYKAHRKWAKLQGDIADVMTGQGACWMMYRDRFWDLGGLDENHGSWGQMGVEIACKSWLSGGRQVVNRKTWFAHLFRCGGSEGCPYPMDGRAQREARKYSIELWTNQLWPQQMRPIEWLIEKFWPVPTWPKPETTPALRDVSMPATTVARPNTERPHPTVSFLIPVRNEKYLAKTVENILENAILDCEVLVGRDGPDDHSELGAIANNPRVRIITSEKRIGMRPTINRVAREARGEYLIRLDGHCTIDYGMDSLLVAVCRNGGPKCGCVAKRYELDTERWERRDKTDVPYRRLSHPSEDGCGLRSLPWPEMASLREKYVIDDVMSCSGSSWTLLRRQFLDWGGFDEQHGTFGQEGCEIACMCWLGGGSFKVRKGTWYSHWNRGKTSYSLGSTVKKQSIEHSKWLWIGNHWPHAERTFDWLIKRFAPPGWPQEPDYENLYNQHLHETPTTQTRLHSSSTTERPLALPAPSQGALMKGRVYKVADLWAGRLDMAEPLKRKPLTKFYDAYSRLAKAVMAGRRPRHTCDDGRPYYEYLITRLHRRLRDPLTHKGSERARRKVADGVDLVDAIMANGLESPLEYYADADGKLVLHKGYRRLAILHALKAKTVPCRIFKNKHAACQHSPVQLDAIEYQAGPLERIARRQFAKHQSNASDKWWVHGYTRYYDRHLASIRRRARKVLELGVLRGASLDLWKAYFPHAKIFGADQKNKCLPAFADGVKIFEGKEQDPSFVAKLVKAGPFDLIVDDASHDPNIQAEVFKALWASVRRQGWYVIEDCHYSYADRYAAKGSPDVPALMAARIRDLYRQHEVLEIAFYYNLCMIRKA